MAMHKGGGKPIKMGTILEMDEGEDFERIMSSRQSETSALKKTGVKM
jgi:hypothetical protein